MLVFPFFGVATVLRVRFSSLVVGVLVSIVCSFSSLFSLRDPHLPFPFRSSWVNLLDQSGGVGQDGHVTCMSWFPHDKTVGRDDIDDIDDVAELPADIRMLAVGYASGKVSFGLRVFLFFSCAFTCMASCRSVLS